MALKRPGSRFEASIWPGFVDAMTALLLILFFVISIFMIVQFTLRETITDQDLELDDLSSQIEQQDLELNDLSTLIGNKEDELKKLSTEILSKEKRLDNLTSEISEKDLKLNSLSSIVTEQDLELDDLSLQLSDLASALGLERLRANGIEEDLGKTKDILNEAEDQISLHLATISNLTKKSSIQIEKIDGYKLQIDSLLSDKLQLENFNQDLAINKSALELQIAGLLLAKSKLEAKNIDTINKKKAIELALVRARNEINEREEVARLAAAKREALELLIVKLQNEGELRAEEITSIRKVLSETEKTRLVEQAAAENLKQKLKSTSDELTSLLFANSKLVAENNNTLNEKNVIELALASARNEINQQVESARLAAAKREALELLIVKLQNESKLQLAEESSISETLTETEKRRLAEAAAAELLREKLKNANTELTAMSLALEAERKEAEITLTKIAAANALEKSLKIDLSKSFTEVERQAALIAEANSLLEKEKDISITAQRKLALLNTQTSQLRNQLNELQGLLDESKEADSKAQIQLKSLGTDLNLALARVAAEQRKVAAEQKKIAELEAKEKLRFAEEAKDLRKFRSQFFGELRKVMEGQEGVRIVGDRFVFSSEVLFSVGSANLGSLGKTEINKVAKIINQIAGEIPDGIDWILRVDGHTDRIPFSGFGKDYKDNWELSQARALSVVRYLMDDLKIPANRLAANGFGEFQPIDDRDTPEAYKTNRRIELKFTEK
ncbi:peptidoglycan -binding protein [Amylibacter sp.]|nr:peptidoglycan -binding protein [Amylibacter sp.]MDA9926040.1 peptidoglycan -binding protein [Amylibacter sp.]MDB2337199.1 peptidoglycan -binding protein [Amylibacter sp.]MDB4087521.1 peptidoglycan -binding protein [Amylibacter sp.]MDB4145606.1 peptidoglycan -binding protein [Amylibacter sp.]|tara:strand:+ start:20904 stop:23114 length:2211 start_codon:yes stop_codon:yes gene_type:complete